MKNKYIGFWPNFELTRPYFDDFLHDSNGVIASHFPTRVDRFLSKFLKIKYFYSGEARLPWTSGEVLFSESGCLNPHFKKTVYFPNWILTTNLLSSFSTLESRRFGYLIDVSSGNIKFNYSGSFPPKKRVACVFGYLNDARISAINSLRNSGFIVDIYGRASGILLKNKLELLGRYDFLLVMENSFKSGYVTEKLIDSYSLGLIPIYFGFADEHSGIKPGSFIPVDWFENFNSLDYFKKVEGVLESNLFANDFLTKLRFDINSAIQ